MVGTYAMGPGCEVYFEGSTLMFRNEWGGVSPAQMLGERRADVWGMTASNAQDGSGIFWLDKNNEAVVLGKWDSVSLSAHRFLGSYLDGGNNAQVIWQNGQLTFVNGLGSVATGSVLDAYRAQSSGNWNNAVAHRASDASKLTWRDSAGADSGTP